MDITDFKSSLINCSLEELETKAEEIRKEIGKMVLDTDLIMKAAIVDSLISEKKADK